MSSTVLFSERRNVSRKHTFLNLIGNGLSNVMTMVNNEVGIGTTVPRSALYIEGDVILKGRFMDSNLNPMMGVLPAWLPMAVAPSFTLPGTGGAVTYSKQQGSFRFAGNEILYNVNIECTVDSQPTGGEAAGDFKLTLPDPVSATSYMAATIVGDLWLSVTLNGGGGEVTNTFKALAKTSTTDATMLTVRYLSGTTEGSLAYMTAGAVIQVQGTMIYTSAREMAALSLPATANRSYQVLQNQALSLLGSTFTWRETQLPPTFVVTAPGVVSYPNVRKGLFKYLGTDVAFNVNMKARIETAPPLASDYKLTLPYPVKLASYAAPTVIGDLLLSVYNGTSSNAFKAYAETMPSDSNSALIRYISGTTEDSLATITQGITFELAGTMTYDTTVMYNGDIYTAYIPPVFSQDTDGNVVMNGSGYLPRGRLDVIDTSTSPVMVVDQKGAGDLVQLKKNGVTQVRVDNVGNVVTNGNLRVDNACNVQIQDGDLILAQNTLVQGQPSLVDWTIDQSAGSFRITRNSQTSNLNGGSFLIDPYGRCGIRLGNPTALLHIGADTTATNDMFHIQKYDTTSLFKVNANGNVGILVKNPTALLHIQADTTSTNEMLHIQKYDAKSLFKVNADGNVGILVKNPTALLHMRTYSTTRNVLHIEKYDATSLFNVKANGDVGIGITDPIYQLQLSRDSAAKPSSSTWTIFSDERIKKDIVVADYATCYSNVQRLDLKHYTYRNDVMYPAASNNNVDGVRTLGWIAQDVEMFLPDSVTTIPEMYGIADFKMLNTDQLYASMYGALRYLMQKVDNLEHHIAFKSL